MTHHARRALALAVPAALVLLTAACGSDDSSAADTPATTTSAPAPSSAASSSAASSAAAPSTAAPAAATMLMAVLGPGDAFTIGLTDADGKAVTTLPAGSYQVMVTDPSAIHNYHLIGPGVDEKTTVPEKTDVTWSVTLQPGTYTYKCDPHRNMVGTFTVT